jgi:acyl carrier protein
MGLYTVSVSLPAVNSIGYAANQGLSDKLKQTVGTTLVEGQVYTVVKGAIMGPSSGLVADGCSLVVTVIPTNVTRSWERFNLLAAWRSAASDSEGGGSRKTTSSTLLADVQGSSDPLESLQGALMDKVSVMTMINREDINTSRSLEEYGLDSLVSVELRNWIRREFGTELPLTAIIRAGNLKALSEKILSLMPAKG